MASFSANMAAMYTAPQLRPAIKSLQDLEKQSLVQYAPMVNTLSYHYFDRMKFTEEILVE